MVSISTLDNFLPRSFRFRAPTVVKAELDLWSMDKAYAVTQADSTTSHGSIYQVYLLKLFAGQLRLKFQSLV